jgi:hypothetical protein
MSGDPLVGRFLVEPLGPKSTLYYKRNGGEYVRFYRPPQAGYVVVLRDVQPEGEVSGESDVTFDTGQQRFVLDEPGMYEFKVVYADVVANRNAVLESDVTAVQVTPPPPQERAAALAYSRDLAMMTQDGLLAYGALPESIAECRRFLARFPGSIYADRVRAALTRSLSYKIRRNKATAEEKEVYESLRAEQLPEQ